ncbi:MAG: 1-(5-phosphoribosyl)-5-[(5-phosphoribosylamino)methylideneamino]imidazole-4-carboxamide isomerase [Ginsengibacter sp.]
MEIIPAIDIIDGKCVRLEKGDFEKKIIYHDDPLEVAKSFESKGITRLHIVDLDGAKGRSLKNLKSLENISKNTSLIVDFGGGLKTTNDLKSVFSAGASFVSIGSIMIKDPDLFSTWIIDFGAEKFLPGTDVLHKKIKIGGWKEETGIDVFVFIKEIISKEINTIFCTDISKDGMMKGPAVELYKEILSQFPALNLIASGGISCYDDLLTLQTIGCKGAIVGKAIYEKKIRLEQIEDFIKNN